MEERSRASAFRPDADRLASRAFAWLEEAVREGTAPSWGYFLRPGANAAAGEGTLPEKMPPVLIPERYGSILPLVLLVPKAFRWSRDTEDRKREGRFSGIKGEIMKNQSLKIVWVLSPAAPSLANSVKHARACMLAHARTHPQMQTDWGSV